MNFFKRKTRWSNAEFIPFKLCVASAYVLIGAYYPKFFMSHHIPVLIVFGVTVIWVVYLWLQKMDGDKKAS